MTTQLGIDFDRHGMGRIRAARLENSPRLQRILAVLEQGGWHGTREIGRDADVYAVGTAIQELKAAKNRDSMRARGWETVESRCVGQGKYEYRLRRRM